MHSTDFTVKVPYFILATEKGNGLLMPWHAAPKREKEILLLLLIKI